MKTTEEMAREAGLIVSRYDISVDPPKRVAEGHLEALERFHQLVRNEALEEAASKIEYGPYPWANENSDTYHIQAEWTKRMQAKVRSMKS